MLETIKALVLGASAQSKARVRDVFVFAMIDPKFREADASLKSAKFALAGLIQRQRAEIRQLDTLEKRIQVLSDRARQPLEEDRNDLAQAASLAAGLVAIPVTGRSAVHQGLLGYGDRVAGAVLGQRG